MNDGDNAILAFFGWWNGAMADPAQLTPEGFARYFADDGRLVVNGQDRAAGVAALASHYQGVAERCDEVRMILPVEQAFVATDGRAFVHCRTHAVVGGKAAAEEAMAYAQVRDGRIALLRVVSLSV